MWSKKYWKVKINPNKLFEEDIHYHLVNWWELFYQLTHFESIVYIAICDNHHPISSLLNCQYLPLGGSQKLENVCRQRFRILKIVQVEPYMIADVEYGFPGNSYSTNYFNMRNLLSATIVYAIMIHKIFMSIMVFEVMRY